jgi:hypothetical protein
LETFVSYSSFHHIYVSSILTYPAPERLNS